MNGLSLSMIVKDEEEFLAGCLESVRDVVDEMVIVDTGSTDATVRIAEEAGARVIRETWNGDFSSMRNRSLEACRGEWILYLDADERLAGGQSTKLAGLLENPRADAYQVLVRSVLSLEGGKRVVQIMPYPRIFRRKDGVRFERQIHEQIAPSILRSGGKIVPSDIIIEHLGYERGFEVLKHKIQRNLGTLLALVERDSRDWYSRFQIARSFMLVQDYPAVVHHARAAIRIPGVPNAVVSALHNLLAEAALKTRNVGQAIHHCEKSLSLYPQQAGAMWFLSGAFMTQGNPRPAIPVLEKLCALVSAKEQAPAELGDIVIPLDAVKEALGRCYFAIGSWERAADAFATALQVNPSTPGASERLINALQKLGGQDVVLRCLRSATDGGTKDTRLLSYRAMIENESGDARNAVATLDRVLALKPLDTTALTWKALWSLRGRDFSTAASVIRIAEEHEVMTDDLTRCAFELAVQENRFTEALARLESIESSFSPEDFAALRSKVERLAKRASPFR